MPECESATVTALAPARGSKRRSFLSLQVVLAEGGTVSEVGSWSVEALTHA